MNNKKFIKYIVIFIIFVALIGNISYAATPKIVDKMTKAFEEIEKWMNHNGISVVSKEDTIQNPQVIEKYNQEVERLSTEFGQWEKIKKFILLAKEWTINDGQLTPKLSLKRKVILKENEEKIDKIYQENI